MKIIEFEDHGQDFLRWTIHEDKVIDCQPFGARFWVGNYIKLEEDIALVRFTPDADWRAVNYPITEQREESEFFKTGFEHAISNKKHVCTFARTTQKKQYQEGFAVGRYNIENGHIEAPKETA